jgi:hypothetical protein
MTWTERGARPPNGRPKSWAAGLMVGLLRIHGARTRMNSCGARDVGLFKSFLDDSEDHCSCP